MKTEILYGFHPVAEALGAGKRKFFEVYLAREKESARHGEILELCRMRNLPVREMKPDRLAKMAGTAEHQGVAAKVSEIRVFGMETVLEKTAKNGTPFFLLLDHVVDPRNFGALVRTALGAGVQAVVTAKDRSAPASPAASKASAGALEHMTLVKVVNLANTMDLLKKWRVWVGGLDGNAPQTIYKWDLTGALALVIGGEQKGIRPLVKQHCDFLLSIPQAGKVVSLNASVAGAVAMYEACRQRNHV